MGEFPLRQIMNHKTGDLILCKDDKDAVMNSDLAKQQQQQQQPPKENLSFFTYPIFRRLYLKPAVDIHH